MRLRPIVMDIRWTDHRLPNPRIKGINAGIRLIQRRANGYASLDNLIEAGDMCHGGVFNPVPTRP